jgi:hypothetical protein
MNRVRVSIGLLLMLAVFSAAVFFVLPKKAFASTGINQELSFEGKIVNSSSGVNIPDATYNMEFKIYSGGTATGGGTLEWTEDYLVAVLTRSILALFVHLLVALVKPILIQLLIGIATPCIYPYKLVTQLHVQ